MKNVYVPKLGKRVKFQDRHAMKRGHPTRRFKLSVSYPPTPLPVDWAKALSFPMDGNDNYGDCMLAGACHADNTFTGNAGTESSFSESAIVNQYLKASGGDNGLDEGTLLNQCWKPGLAGNAQATILDALDLDPTDTAAAQAAIYLFGGVLFMLDVPDAWIDAFDPAGGAVWDAPARADSNNGHGVWWNGVDASGRYRAQTWGSYVRITPAGVQVCDPSAFVVFSLRWFDSSGYAPNGKHYTELAQFWQQFGGATLPPSPFPAPGPTPTPPVPVPPAPTPSPAPSQYPTLAQWDAECQRLLTTYPRMKSFIKVVQKLGASDLGKGFDPIAVVQALINDAPQIIALAQALATIITSFQGPQALRFRDTPTDPVDAALAVVKADAAQTAADSAAQAQTAQQLANAQQADQQAQAALTADQTQQQQDVAALIAAVQSEYGVSA